MYDHEMQPSQTTDEPTALQGKETEHIQPQHKKIKLNRKDPRNIATRQGCNKPPHQIRAINQQIKTTTPEHFVSLQDFS